MPTSRVGVLVLFKEKNKKRKKEKNKKKKIEINSMSRSKRMMDREAGQLQIASGGLAWFQSCTGPILWCPFHSPLTLSRS